MSKKYTGQERRANGFTAEDGISLKSYIDTRFNALERATDLLADNYKTRFESLNEWRLQNKDERTMYVTKTEHDFIVKDIRELREQAAELRGKASQDSVVKVAIATGVSIFISMATFLFGTLPRILGK